MTKAAEELLTAKAWYSKVLPEIKKKMFCMSRNSPWTGHEDLNASLLNVSIPCLDLLTTKKIPKSVTYNFKFLYYLFKWFL